MVLKYNVEITETAIKNRVQNLINQIYKLLPMREEGLNWEKPLQTAIQELVGMQRLMNCGFSDIFFPLLSKLEGLYSLTKQEDFFWYRRTIFDCLRLMNNLQKEICPQNY